MVSPACSLGIEKGAAEKLEPLSPREWGRRQAAASPVWSEEKWKRIGVILGVEFTTEPHTPGADEQSVPTASELSEAA